MRFQISVSPEGVSAAFLPPRRSRDWRRRRASNSPTASTSSPGLLLAESSRWALRLVCRRGGSQSTFREHGETVFPRSWPPLGRLSKALDLVRFAGQARYRAEPLARLVGELVREEMKIGDLDRRVTIPAVNLTKGRHTRRRGHAAACRRGRPRSESGRPRCRSSYYRCRVGRRCRAD